MKGLEIDETYKSLFSLMSIEQTNTVHMYLVMNEQHAQFKNFTIVHSKKTFLPFWEIERKSKLRKNYLKH